MDYGISRHVLRALHLLDVAERGGVPPTKAQLDLFATSPAPSPGVEGNFRS